MEKFGCITLMIITIKYAPVCQIHIRNRCMPNPWFNHSIQEAIYTRNYYHKKDRNEKKLIP